MAKKQTRRSVSVSQGMYALIKDHVEAHGYPSMSKFVEASVKERMASDTLSAIDLPGKNGVS